MTTYGLPIAKANIINEVVKLVTPETKWCLIKCSIRYTESWDVYIVKIDTTSILGNYVKLGEININSVVERVFSLRTGAKIGVEYNGRHVGSFTDKE